MKVWYEYKTNPIFITKDEDAYNALLDMINFDLSGYENTSDAEFMWRVIWEENVVQGLYNTVHVFEKAYNAFANGKGDYLDASSNQYSWNGYLYKTTPLARMDWLFLRENPSTFDDFKVSSAEVEEYMNWYTEKFSTQEKVEDNHGGRFAKGLFADVVDEGRTYGYNVREIDAGEEKELLFQKDQSFWNKFWHGIKYEEQSYAPIVQLDSSIRNMTANDFSETYYINASEASDVRAECIAMLDRGEVPVLFRFAQTDYYASDARFDRAGGGTGMSSVDGYVAQETVFLDFDMISLTFRDQDGGDTVIGVVSDPMDIINGVDPSPGVMGDSEWGVEDYIALALGAILLLGLLIVAAPILPYIVKGIVWVIVLPFKAIGWVFKAIIGAFKKDGG